MKNKVVIIGAGSVGSTIAYALMIQGIPREIAIVDIDVEKAEGEVLDLNHGLNFVSPVNIKVGEYADCAEAEIIIITAGAKQKPGESRLDLVGKNLGIMRNIIENITQQVTFPQNSEKMGKLEQKGESKLPILLIVSNPCDILTYAAWKYSGFPSQNVIGSGTTLDSSRLRSEISRRCKIDAQNIHGYIVGEHGDSELALWSSLTIGNTLFQNYCQDCEEKKLRKCHHNQDEIEETVRKAAYVLIDKKGYTNYAIGLAASHIVKVILRDQNTILPVSTPLSGQYGLDSVALSIPCILNQGGVREILELELSSDEQEKFHSSGQKLKALLKKVNLN